jgi:hypothetical protein
MDTEPTPPPIVNEDTVRRVSLESLLIFLDKNEANCPECGYSLCGIKSVNCPECGWVITLCPNDGIDRRRIIQTTRWFVYMGLILSLANMMQWIGVVVMSGWSYVSDWRWLVFEAIQMVLFVLSMSSMIYLLRRSHSWPTRILLIHTRWISLAIVSVIAITSVTTFCMWLVESLWMWLV